MGVFDVSVSSLEGLVVRIRGDSERAFDDECRETSDYAGDSSTPFGHSFWYIR